MSKTVIVFSTRFIDPLFDDRLFSKGHYDREVFSSKKLADFFWDDIKKDTVFLESLLTTDNYFVNEKKQDLIQFLSKNQDSFKNLIKENNIQTSFSTEDFTWTGDIFAEDIDLPLIEELSEKIEAYYNSIEKTQIENEDSLTLCGRLKKDTNNVQTPYNLDKEANTQLSPGPWLHYRFSYYKLKNKNSDDVAVYAVWPLYNISPLVNGNSPWVEALVDQFLNVLNPGAEELFLILHDNDIEDHTPFKVIIDDKLGRTSRHVALFQHDSIDEIGSFLLKAPNNSCPEDVRDYVEEIFIEARIRNWLFEAYDYITNDDIYKLWKAAANLIKLNEKEFKDIYEIADKIEGGTPTATKQHLDELKLNLISILNQKLGEYMIIR